MTEKRVKAELPSVTLFYTKASPFSNFFACPFVYAGNPFTSSEQAFMYAKALEFGDVDSAQKILHAKTPYAAQQLGRKIKPYDDARWSAARQELMYAVLLAKFSQNPSLAEALCATGESRIAEASPRDRVWGIGLGETDPDALDQSKWKGTNLLGGVLERVRAELIDHN